MGLNNFFPKKFGSKKILAKKGLKELFPEKSVLKKNWSKDILKAKKFGPKYLGKKTCGKKIFLVLNDSRLALSDLVYPNLT